MTAPNITMPLQEVNRDLSGVAQVLYVMSCGPEGFDTHDAARLLNRQVEAAISKIENLVAALLKSGGRVD